MAIRHRTFRFYDEDNFIVNEVSLRNTDTAKLSVLFYIHCCELDVLEPTDDDILLFEMTGFKIDNYNEFMLAFNHLISLTQGVYSYVKKAKMSSPHGPTWHILEEEYFIDINFRDEFDALIGVSIMNTNRTMRF